MQHTTADPANLTKLSEAPPVGLLSATLFLLAVALVVWLLKRKADPPAPAMALEQEPRRQGQPFVLDRGGDPEPCCTVAEAVRDYFADPPRSLLTAVSEIVAQSQALARLELEMEEKLEQRLKEHREETNQALREHREEVSTLLMNHVAQVSSAVATANQAQTDKILAAIKAAR
jgi:hypothetical protein